MRVNRVAAPKRLNIPMGKFMAGKGTVANLQARLNKAKADEAKKKAVDAAKKAVDAAKAKLKAAQGGSKRKVK